VFGVVVFGVEEGRTGADLHASYIIVNKVLTSLVHNITYVNVFLAIPIPPLTTPRRWINHVRRILTQSDIENLAVPALLVAAINTVGFA
jgi:hypothetical protein